MSTNTNDCSSEAVSEQEVSEIKATQENSVTSSDVNKELENNATKHENKDNEIENIDNGKEQSGKVGTSKTSDGKKENEKKESPKKYNKKDESEGNDTKKKESNKEGNGKDVHDNEVTEKDKSNKKDNEKDVSNKKDNEKDVSNKEENEKDDSDKVDIEKDESEKEESEDEQELGLLDRPVEVVTGCRARKQVERLDVSYAVPKKDKQIPEGRGTKLGDCPRIEFQIAKHSVADLKPLHRVLFNRQGTVNDTKKNIRKFSGFPFDENSIEFEKTKAKTEKNSSILLKKMCEVLDLERGGTKEDIIMRILQFLICPSDSGKQLPKKKSSAKKTASKKKSKSTNKKSKAKSSDEEGDDEIAPSADEASDASANEEETSDVEIKKKSNAKSKTPIKTKNAKKEKTNKAKGTKRKKNVSESSDEDDEPVAKKSKLPNDEEIEKLVKTILEKADLHVITMKKVMKQVYDTYPGCDLTDKKSFIKQTIKSVLQLKVKGEAEER